MPAWNSSEERECRGRLEEKKEIWCRSAGEVEHPCLTVKDDNLDIARGNLRRHDWAKTHYEELLNLGAYYTDRSDAWIARMVPDLTPAQIYGTFCPVCAADNTYNMRWIDRDPDKLVCFHCGAIMTDEAHPEEGRLELPRSGQTLAYYIRPEERDDAEFTTGRNAFSWAGRRVHSSYSGAIRQQKAHRMPAVARNLAILYRMEGEDRYARAAAAILNRFAAVYPNYLFRDYWNTYMDCDPLYACELMAQDRGIGRYEVNPCPDQNARSPMKSGKLIQTFWGCGRLSGGGVQSEAHYICMLAEALDLLWEEKDGRGHLFLTERERDRIVKDLLVEGLFTFTHWEGINNKVAGCREGEVALGRFLGVPDYVHRGVEGFEPYLKGFFKFDGSTAEGSSYYLYAVANVRNLPELAHGYSDPPSYGGKDRYDNLNLYEPGGPYHTVLRARTLMTLPDGRLPHTADAREGKPDWPHPAWIHNVGLVRMGNDFAPFVRLDTGDAFAFFNRPANLEPAPPPPVRDRFFPGWLLAIFDTGYDAMFRTDLTGAATFLMNFYQPEGHDHPDALNIAMNVEGVEVLSDLGYIGDHPLNASIRSTLKHNLVVLDEENQLPRDRRPPGNLRLLAASPATKTIEADCRAYEQAETYSRFCAMVHRSAGPAYLVDVFRVRGGRVHDYAIHGEGRISSPPAQDRPIPMVERPGLLGEDIEKLRAGSPSDPWTVSWSDSGMTMRARMVSPVDEIIVGEGPGQRSHSEIGARNDYLFARKAESGNGSTFVAVIDHFRQDPDILDVQPLSVPDNDGGPVALRIRRGAGDDTVINTPDQTERAFGDVVFAGRAAVYTRCRDGRQSLFMTESTRFASPDLSVTLDAASIEGDIAGRDRGGFRTRETLPHPGALADHFVRVQDPDQGCWTAYRIRSAAANRIDVDEFPFNAGASWQIPSLFSIEQASEDTFEVRTTNPARLLIRTPHRGAFIEHDDGARTGIETDTAAGMLSLTIHPAMTRPHGTLLRLE